MDLANYSVLAILALGAPTESGCKCGNGVSVRILIDSREQLPFTFAGYEVTPEVAALPVGDYSLPDSKTGSQLSARALMTWWPVSWAATGKDSNVS